MKVFIVTYWNTEKYSQPKNVQAFATLEEAEEFLQKKMTPEWVPLMFRTWALPTSTGVAREVYAIAEKEVTPNGS